MTGDAGLREARQAVIAAWDDGWDGDRHRTFSEALAHFEHLVETLISAVLAAHPAPTTDEAVKSEALREAGSGQLPALTEDGAE